MCGSVEFGAWLNMNWCTGSAGPLYSFSVFRQFLFPKIRKSESKENAMNVSIVFIFISLELNCRYLLQYDSEFVVLLNVSYYVIVNYKICSTVVEQGLP